MMMNDKKPDIENTSAPSSDNAPEPIPTDESSAVAEPRTKRPKFSGAYWYCELEDDELKKQQFIRTLLTAIAFLLQLVVLLLPQGGLEYVTNNIPSYAYVYMWFVFIMLGVSIYLFVMNMTRYKLLKRIPKEYAPKNGFKRRSFFGAELFVVVYALIFVLELSFVCIHFDGVGLAAMFIALLSVAAAVWARQVTVITLKDATLVPAPETASEQEETETLTDNAENND